MEYILSAEEFKGLRGRQEILYGAVQLMQIEAQNYLNFLKTKHKVPFDRFKIDEQGRFVEEKQQESERYESEDMVIEPANPKSEQENS